MKFGSQHAETEEKAGFHNERQRIFTLQAFSPCPVNEEFRQGGTGNKTDECTDTGKGKIDISDDEAIGHTGDNPRHVRGILLDSQKTTRAFIAPAMNAKDNPRWISALTLLSTLVNLRR